MVGLHVTVQVFRFLTGDDRLFGLVYMFSLGAETNVPAFYATFSLLFTALLLAAVGVASRGDGSVGTMYWLGLAVVFLFLSMDEMLGFHERLSEPLRSELGTSGLLYYAWVIPYGLGVLGLAAVYLRFLARLPRQTSVRFIGAGILFVSGAIGAEMVGGWVSEQYGNANVGFVAIQTIEEVLEMVGILVFISAILEYSERQFNGLRLYVSSGRIDDSE
ncbi:MAG: hypothetical protein PVJ80_06830 [Gemmatimonadota bacterium]